MGTFHNDKSELHGITVVVDTKGPKVFVGRCDDAPVPDPAEADGWRWVPLERLRAEVAADPAAFTPWFRILLAEPRLHRALQGVATG